MWEPILELIESQFDSFSFSIQESVMKCVQDYVYALSSDKVTSRDGWTRILTFINARILDEQEIIRSMALDTLSFITEEEFSCLPLRAQTSFLCISLGLLKDSDANVRAAACRVLGVLVVFECVKEDTLSVAELASQIPELVQDMSLTVRMRASYALSNLSLTLLHLG